MRDIFHIVILQACLCFHAKLVLVIKSSASNYFSFLGSFASDTCWLLARYLLLSNMDVWCGYTESIFLTTPVSVSLNNIKRKTTRGKRVLSDFWLFLFSEAGSVCGIRWFCTMLWAALNNSIHVQRREGVNLRTSSQSAEALSYQGSEAWSEFISGPGEMEWRVRHGSEGRETQHPSLHSEERGGRVQESWGGKTEMGHERARMRVKEKLRDVC